MKEKAFTEKTIVPDDDLLKAALGASCEYYTIIIKKTENFEKKNI